MKSYTWIQRAKKQNGLTSDYQAAKALGLTQASISNHKSGKSNSLDDDTCLKLSQMLDIPVEQILFDQKAESAKNPEIKQLWSKLAKKAASLSPIILTVLTFSKASTLGASVIFGIYDCILC